MQEVAGRSPFDLGAFERLFENGSILVRSDIAKGGHYALFRPFNFLNCRILSTCKFLSAEPGTGSNPLGDANVFTTLQTKRDSP